MGIYRMADMNIEIDPRYKFTEEYISEYKIDSDIADFSITVSDDMIEYERSLNSEIHGYDQANALCEITAILRVISEQIIERGGFFLHCSCLKIDGSAVVFTAPSGTGKSTHARLWRERFKDRVEMINDDKPLVREKDGEFIIYGTPFSGKHGIANNISAPIKAVFCLQQSKVNRVVRLDAVTALTCILKQTLIPDTKNAMNLLMDMLGRLIENVPFYRLECDISDEAVNASYNAFIQSVNGKTE